MKGTNHLLILTGWFLSCQMRAGKLGTQIEAAFKQMDTAGTELECFQALQKQEQLSATYRISNLWEEVQKQKDLERILQTRYGDQLSELERLQHSIEAYRLHAERDEENAAAKNNDSAMDDADTALNQSVVPNPETPIPMEEVTTKETVIEQSESSDLETPSPMEELPTKENALEAEAEAAVKQSAPSDIQTPDHVDEGNSVEVLNNTYEMRSQQLDAAEVDAGLGSEGGIDDGEKENATSAAANLETAGES